MTIKLPDTILDIGAFAFSGCTMENISLGNSLREVGERAFHNCQNLKKLVFPEGMEMFAGVSISSCNDLEEVIIPDTVILDKDTVFMFGCPNAVVVTPANTKNNTLLREWGYIVKNE